MREMAIPFIPLRRSTFKTPPLPVTMSGVRLGERVLQVGVDDAAIAGAIAAAVGITGRAAFVVHDDAAAARARAAATEASAPEEIKVAPLMAFPFEAGAFDLVLVNARSGWFHSLQSGLRAQAIGEAYRVLRQGGRLLLVEPGRRVGFAALFRRGAPPASTDSRSSAVLRQAGFRLVRGLGDHEGCLFTEGLKQ